jgi:hypothetical protein
MARALAKPDKTGHALALTLTMAQRNAIDQLIGGATDAQAAEAAGVSRQTVNGWRNYDPAFRAELNRCRDDLWRASADRLRALVPKALSTLEGELEHGDNVSAVKAAVAILKVAGAERLLPEPGEPMPTEALAIIDAEVRRRWDDLMLAGHSVTDRDREELLREWSVRAAEVTTGESPKEG